MMKFAIACAFLAVVVTALPSDNVVPETELYTQQVQLHKEASMDIDTLLETGKTKDACASLADATTKEITDSVAASQKVMNAVPKGSACKKEGQPAVDSAKKALDSAKSKDSSARSAYDKAKKAPVKFADINIAQAKANDCSAFFADPAYTAAKKAADAAGKKHAEATGQLKAAQTAYDNAVSAQKAAIKACACHTKWRHEQAKKAADKSNSSENAKAWSKSHMMKCVLAGTSALSCKVPPTPKVTIPALEEPAKSASCSAPTPPPTQPPTKSPTAPEKFSLKCSHNYKENKNAGATVAKVSDLGAHYTLTGGGIFNFKNWGKLGAIEQFYPDAVAGGYNCDTGFGPGHVRCYTIGCVMMGQKTNKALTCTTKTARVNKKSGSITAHLPAGYTMTGGGLYNHHRSWDKHAQFEQSRPNGNDGWLSDMGFGWGDFTSYVTGCKGLTCKTVHSKQGDATYARCPSGYMATGCGMQNDYSHMDKLALFEHMIPMNGNVGCYCNTGSGAGKNHCWARCCKLA